MEGMLLLVADQELPQRLRRLPLLQPLQQLPRRRPPLLQSMCLTMQFPRRSRKT